MKQYVTGWPEITFINIQDENGYLFTEWQKKPVKFGPGILKFESPVKIGNEQFGILSLYVDLSAYYSAMETHISANRRNTALILLSITMMIVFMVNYSTLKKSNDKSGGREA